MNTYGADHRGSLFENPNPRDSGEVISVKGFTSRAWEDAFLYQEYIIGG